MALAATDHIQASLIERRLAEAEQAGSRASLDAPPHLAPKLAASAFQFHLLASAFVPLSRPSNQQPAAFTTAIQLMFIALTSLALNLVLVIIKSC